MYTLAFKQFIRSKAVVTGLLFILIIGGFSLLSGGRFLRQQKEAAAFAAAYQQQHMDQHTQFFQKEMGLLLYSLRFSLINHTEPLAGLSIGQRDINPSIQRVTIRNLENQRYDTDLSNPLNLSLGNLDWGFVMIYLFPLLIIAFTYNLLSEEREGGTWNLVRVQSPLPLRALWMKLSLRILAVFAAAALLLIMAILWLPLPLNSALLAVALLFTCYLLCWFGISFWVISWRKDSGFNAVSLLSCWVVLTLLLPALANSYITHSYPLPEALATTVKQRQGYHEKWDMDKGPTIRRFYAHYPQFSKYGVPEQEFTWLWYYAMQQMGDDEAAQETKKLREKVLQRDAASNKAGLLLPPLHAQLALNNLARTGLQDHIGFLDSTQRFHERIKLEFYPKIFEEQAVEGVDWKALRPEYFSAAPAINWPGMLLPLLLFGGLLFGWGRYNFSKPELSRINL
jgi:ABC-2 type transport system permease protein